MKNKFIRLACLLVTLALTQESPAFYNPVKPPVKGQKVNTSAKNIKLPAGFSASIIASDLGATRHIAISKKGDLYVKLSKLKDGKGIYLLRDTDKDGVIDDTKLFGDYPGTGIYISNGYLYTSSNSAVYRYKLNANEEVINFDQPEKIVGGLVDKGRDNAKPLAVDKQSNIYVTIGSYNDPCREAGSGKGMNPCSILDSAGGIWKFNSEKLNQTFADGIRYATGLKNSVGIAWNYHTNSLFATQHGRGQFHDFYPQYYTAKQSAELPAETLYELHQGDNAGWPYIYYDQFQKKKILAPEYGGDGIKTGEEKALNPVVAFPAHLGPNALLFYTGKMFPEKYRNGAFIAFHGQSPELHKGYLVAFVPFVNNKPSGKWEIFADNFAGTDLAKPTGPIGHRPCGLAQGPDGALYVTDDLNGTIFRISYKKRK
ncbi:Glucose/arabinose dehydrogenase, beta-propeller fold [Pseudarcicella hirudinis]|uniref:Glucose/arabinose dehydrogenase, beta-propeller fold n=1 Tax=Pseudarcicella hirudinis TaxID=1079859 RepID=A0A1I5UWM0_9BACT|nr:PQQ-dependent sugar dehydrogenase [Pseudarcicella hirudinis]SFP99620.1 Glucose/arabinose dehydrogenase, beta-propeller fold [Pseudarcicella hirudinis]